MFTDAQMEIYRSLQSGELGCPPDMEWQPPRVLHVSDFPALANQGSDFGNGNILFVGFINQDMVDCECDHDHITYVSIIADGLMSNIFTSNTVDEAMATAMVDPISVLLGMVDPNEVEPVLPTWDAAREVTPDEWPATPFDDSEPILTDMSSYEWN